VWAPEVATRLPATLLVGDVDVDSFGLSFIPDGSRLRYWYAAVEVWFKLLG
jgi:hypothetical protein